MFTHNNKQIYIYIYINNKICYISINICVYTFPNSLYISIIYCLFHEEEFFAHHIEINTVYLVFFSRYFEKEELDKYSLYY